MTILATSSPQVHAPNGEAARQTTIVKVLNVIPFVFKLMLELRYVDKRTRANEFERPFKTRGVSDHGTRYTNRF